MCSYIYTVHGRMNNVFIVNTCQIKIWGNPVNLRLNMSGGIAQRVIWHHMPGRV